MEADELINAELALTGTDALDVVPQKDDSLPAPKREEESKSKQHAT